MLDKYLMESNILIISIRPI